MKRLYRSSQSDDSLLEIDICVYQSEEAIENGSIMNVDKCKFHDFEADILDMFEQRDYELEDEFGSPVKGSNSHYYIYTKVENGVKLKVLVKLRLSDHCIPDRFIRGKQVSQKDSSAKYTKELAKSIAKDKYNQTRGYRSRNIDIVFNDKHYTSYEDALRDIEASLDEFDK